MNVEQRTHSFCFLTFGTTAISRFLSQKLPFLRRNSFPSASLCEFSLQVISALRSPFCFHVDSLEPRQIQKTSSSGKCPLPQWKPSIFGMEKNRLSQNSWKIKRKELSFDHKNQEEFLHGLKLSRKMPEI